MRKTICSFLAVFEIETHFVMRVLPTFVIMYRTNCCWRSGE
jgi:hypothetical protein